MFIYFIYFFCRVFAFSTRLLHIEALKIYFWGYTLSGQKQNNHMVTEKQGHSEETRFGLSELLMVGSVWYDAVGNRTTMVYNNATTRYTYNNLNQLTYRYAGNTEYSYGYDQNGNCGGFSVEGEGPFALYTYDRENRLTRATRYAPSYAMVDYIYCALGKRMMKGYNNNTTVYFFDGINTILEKYKASNWSSFSTSAVYTLAPGVVGHIISVRKNNTDYYYHYDQIGNVMFIIDNSGNKVADYVQEGFGNVLATNGSFTSNTYHLTTKEQEPETALYYFYARWYDPVVGRFITRDPIVTGCGKAIQNVRHPLNTNYLYVENNPLAFTDPEGMVKRPSRDEICEGLKENWCKKYWSDSLCTLCESQCKYSHKDPKTGKEPVELQAYLDCLKKHEDLECITFWGEIAHGIEWVIGIIF
ncbi:MAG: RHS repeat-associated core domain-containing protein [bacterium]|nr:RHS repeat-associated core domain-containing protein [bacterium]